MNKKGIFCDVDNIVEGTTSSPHCLLSILTPQTITNTRVRLLKKLFSETGGDKDFDSSIKNYGMD